MATIRKALKNIASGKGAQKLNPPTQFESVGPAETELVSLPNAIPKQYPPLILVHVLLLSAALVLLPQTPLPDLPLPPPARGLDKPQHPFLAPITARPVLTLAWACFGAALFVSLWAGSLRRWVHDGTLGSRSIQLRLQGDPHKRRVRMSPHSFRILPQTPHYLFAHVGHLECMRLHRVHCACSARSHHFAGSAFRPVRPTYLSTPPILSFTHPPSYVPHTALLAFLLAIYTVFPPAYALGPPRLGLPLISAYPISAVVQNDLWIRIFVERKQVSLSLLRLVHVYSSFPQDEEAC